MVMPWPRKAATARSRYTVFQRTMAATIRFRPLARYRWFSKLRSRRSPWRLKKTLHVVGDVPTALVHKWAREALLTVPGARTFIIEDLRNGGDPNNTHGIVEVRLEKGKTVVRGLTTTLPKLRSMGRAGWRAPGQQEPDERPASTLLLYPDHPFGIEEIWGKQYDPKQGCMVPFFVTKPPSLPETEVYAKEQRLIEDIREELKQGRRCQVYATFTGKHDVTGRLAHVLGNAGFRVAVLRSTVPTDKREAWYEKQLKEGVEVVICHPRLVETGLDLLAFPTLYFYETGYSLHTLRQASRRSWRIGQHLPVRVKFLAYSGTMQETCIRHMGKKMLVALMMEGKFSGEGLQSLDANEDLLSAMARELVEKGGVGETADAVWKDLERERAKQAPAPKPMAEVITLPVTPVEQEKVEILPEPADLPAPAGLQLVFPATSRPKRKSAPLWPTGHTHGEQMRLFG